MILMVGVVACSSPPALADFGTADIEVGGHRMTVSVADDPAERSQGLRGVEALPGGIDGMLFLFGEPSVTTFGMRETLIPLDIWWFGPDARLIGSARMEPCESEPCLGYGSPGEISWALETPAGEIDLGPGDHLVVLGPS